MKDTKLINCGNYFQSKYFEEVCQALEQGDTVKVYISCIGHTRNNMTQEDYKAGLVKKYGDRLLVKAHEGVCCYSYSYSLAKGK